MITITINNHPSSPHSRIRARKLIVILSVHVSRYGEAPPSSPDLALASCWLSGTQSITMWVCHGLSENRIPPKILWFIIIFPNKMPLLEIYTIFRHTHVHWIWRSSNFRRRELFAIICFRQDLVEKQKVILNILIFWLCPASATQMLS